MKYDRVTKPGFIKEGRIVWRTMFSKLHGLVFFKDVKFHSTAVWPHEAGTREDQRTVCSICTSLILC